MLYASKFYEFINSTGVAIPDLVANKRSMYHVRYIPKPNGKQRKICEPLGFLREVQEFIAAGLSSTAIFPANACAYIPGRGLKSHLKAHAPADFIVALDIKDFFPSCHPILIEKALKGVLSPERSVVAPPIEIQNSLIRDIADLCTLDGGLPQGAPSSPVLSNIVLLNFDQAVKHMTEAFSRTSNGFKGTMYTRYADDILFSGHGNRGRAKDFAAMVIENIERALYQLGYMQLNYKKTQLIVRNENRLLISNKFVVYSDGSLALTRRYREHIEGLMFHFARDRKPLDEHILGKLSWVRHINEAQYVKLIQCYNSLVDKDYGGR